MREGIKAATDDLRKKSISLAQSHYGSLSYILAYAASGFDCDIHLMNKDGEVRPSDLHCVRPLIVQAFASFCKLSVKVNVTFGFGIGTMSNHWLILPVTHFWVLQTKDICVPASLNNNGPTMVLQVLSQILSLSRLHCNSLLCTCLLAV